MTQKELSYLEDAIGHEGNIIKIINESLNYLEDDKLISFMQNELSIHTEEKTKLMNYLEGKSNE